MPVEFDFYECPSCRLSSVAPRDWHSDHDPCPRCGTTLTVRPATADDRPTHRDHRNPAEVEAERQKDRERDDAG